MTNRGAAIAGVVTHLPGVFYLVALDLIISWDGKSAARGLREHGDVRCDLVRIADRRAARGDLRPEWAREAVDDDPAFARATPRS